MFDFTACQLEQLLGGKHQMLLGLCQGVVFLVVGA
jgi:hypothetical protein